VYLKRFNYGITLAEILFSMAISAFIMCAILGLLANALLHKQFYNDIFNEWQKKARILSTIENRISNAGLGIPSTENVENIFRFTASGTSLLPGWRDVLEVLSSNDIPVHFQNIGGEQVARGVHIRVLSIQNAVSRVKIIPASTEWGPNEIRIVNLRKNANESFTYGFSPGELSSWITTPSLGRPVIIRNLTAPRNSSQGNVQLQNPLNVSIDWHGIDMFHNFRITYFFVEAETLFIRDSTTRDTTNAIPSTPLPRQPLVDDVLSACFELNRTTRTLKCWFLIRSTSPTKKPGIPHEWPAWAMATTRPNISVNKLKVVSHSWRIKNF